MSKTASIENEMCEREREREIGTEYELVVYNYYQTKYEPNGTYGKCENCTAFSFFIFKCAARGGNGRY